MIERFLRHVLPEAGIYCLATKAPHGGYVHTITKSIAAMSLIAKNVDLDNKDTFFAVGTLKEEKVWNPEKVNYDKTVGGWERRTHANMNQFKTLILDLDCNGVKRYEYESQAAAIRGLKALTDGSGMPVPTVVSSGRGLHVYWTFTEAVDAEVWYDLSVKASLVYKHFKLRVDPTRVKDKSSVLRVAGTHHYKDPTNPLDVKVLKWGEHISVSELESILDKCIAFHNLVIPEKFVKTETTPEQIALKAMFAAAGIVDNIEEGVEADIEPIFERCQQMREARDVGGPVGYALRACVTSIIKFTKTKDYSIMYANDPNPETVKSQTESFIVDSVTDHPNTCERFESQNVGGCRGCQEKVNSPIALGYPKRDRISKEVQEAIIAAEERSKIVSGNIEQLEVVTETPKQVTRIEPPAPWRCSPAGVHMNIPNEEGGGHSLEMVYEYELYPYERVWDFRENSEVIKARVNLPHDNEREIIIPAGILADTRALAKLLASNGVIAQDFDKTNLLGSYMSNYIRELQKNFRATTNYAQLGWHEDGTKFILPNLTIRNDGGSENCGISSSVSSITKSFRKRGTLEAWKEVVDTYNNPGYEPYAFGHLVGYGSILFEFTEYFGAIVNMIGNSGSGKSTVLMTINSIFGHPTEPMLMQHDKYLARMNRIGVFNSIAVTYDEITNIPKEELSELCYSVSQGRGRIRLNQNAEEKENNTTWKMIMACSSNASLYDILGANSANSSAEAMRVFEYRVDRQNAMQLGHAKRVFSQLNDNFGHAGEIYVDYVATHRAELRELITHFHERFETEAGVPVQERYWANIVACCLAGGTIAKKLGLNSFDIEVLFNWAIEQIKYMRSSVSEIGRDGKSLLIEFMNANVGSTMIVRGKTGTKGGRQFVDEKGEPRYSLLIRNEIDMGLAYIPREVIRAFLQKNGCDFTSIKKELLDSKILVKDNARKNLAMDSNNTSISGQSYCWLINTNHKEMAGAVINVMPADVREEHREVGAM